MTWTDTKATVTQLNTHYNQGMHLWMHNTQRNGEADGRQQQKTTTAATPVSQEQEI